MVGSVPMTQAIIVPAHRALDGNQLFFLAVFVRTFVGEDFRFVRFAVLIDMLADGHVG